jgi:hypothetical protein
MATNKKYTFTFGGDAKRRGNSVYACCANSRDAETIRVGVKNGSILNMSRPRSRKPHACSENFEKV